MPVVAVTRVQESYERQAKCAERHKSKVRAISYLPTLVVSYAIHSQHLRRSSRVSYLTGAFYQNPTVSKRTVEPDTSYPPPVLDHDPSQRMDFLIDPKSCNMRGQRLQRMDLKLCSAAVNKSQYISFLAIKPIFKYLLLETKKMLDYSRNNNPLFDYYDYRNTPSHPINLLKTSFGVCLD